MSESTPKRKMTAEELLNAREEAWRMRLRSVSLITESLPKFEHVMQALKVLGKQYLRHSDAHARENTLLRWRAVQVITTSTFASERFERGTFWPQFLEAAGIPNEPANQHAWGSAYLRNLDLLGLTDFRDVEDHGLRYLGPIVLHAGVPTYCLADYFTLIADRRRIMPGLTPEGLIAWVTDQEAASRNLNVDKPVTRFLRHGGDFALDVTDRVFDLLDAVSTGRDEDGSMLPERFVDAARKLHSEILLPTPTERADRLAGSSTTAPRLVLDSLGEGLKLRLPSVETDTMRAIEWTITLGNSLEHLAAVPEWPGDPAPSVAIAIPRPLRSVRASFTGHENHPFDVPVVDSADPLFVFDTEGELLPTRVPIRDTQVWLFYAPATTGQPLVVDGTEPKKLADGVLPPGWAEWTLELVDLAGVNAVRHAGSARWHRVRSLASAQIVKGSPIKGVTTTAGFPVYDTAPSIILPKAGADGAEWKVTILDGEGAPLISARTIEGDVSPTDDLWDELPRPLLGSYAIRVRGPWGRGASTDLMIAEGLKVTSDPIWRRMTREGLVDVGIQLATPPGLHASHEHIHLGSTDDVRRINLHRDNDRITLTVRPPHMSVAFQAEGTTLPPSIRPHRLVTDDVLKEGGILSLSMGADASPRLHAIAGGDVVQVLEAKGPVRGGLHRFDLRALGDSLRERPHMVLALDPTAEVRLATISPRQLYETIEIEGDRLYLVGAPPIDGLVAAVYAMRAPWLSGTKLPVADGGVQLPEHLVDAGPLAVHVFIEDPWVQKPLPSWPPKSGAIAEQPGWLRSDDEVEQALSRWLAGVGDFPAGDADFTWLWTILSRIRWIGLGARIPEVANACAEEIREAPAPALMALNEAQLDAKVLPEVATRSGVLTLPTRVDGSRVRVEWTPASALTAALITSRELVRQKDADSPLVDAARLVCGDVLDQLLDGKDPYPTAGQLSPTTDLYIRLSDEEKAGWKRQLKLVPQGLLELDSRVNAALSVLDHGDKASSELRHRQAGKSLSNIEYLLKTAGDDQGLAAVQARKHPTRTQGISTFTALSMGWAWVARRAARGHKNEQTWMESQLFFWSDLARLAPTLVTIDLMIAELLQAAREEGPTE